MTQSTGRESLAAELTALYPSLGVLIPAELDVLTAQRVPAGTTLFDVTQPCRGFPLVIEGEIKVLRRSAEGRSLELYRVVAGEICLVSSASLFGHTTMTATGVTTRPTRLSLIPPATFFRWLEHAAFRESVLGLYAERMAELGLLIDAVAFRRLDQRLAGALLGHGREIATTHQALAEELGTVREIVTRLLHRFEREGWITLSREHILILDSAALRACANGLANGMRHVT